MTVIEIIDIFTFYGVDVVLLAALTAVVVQVCKLTFLKNVPKKFITFLPVILGVVFYAVYAAIWNLDFLYVFEHFGYIVEGGVSVGAVATLLYVFYEQFMRGQGPADTGEAVVFSLIDGYVETESAEETAKLICEILLSDTDEGAEKTKAILTENAKEGITETDVSLLTDLIIETFAHIATE